MTETDTQSHSHTKLPIFSAPPYLFWKITLMENKASTFPFLVKMVKILHSIFKEKAKPQKSSPSTWLSPRYCLAKLSPKYSRTYSPAPTHPKNTTTAPKL